MAQWTGSDYANAATGLYSLAKGLFTRRPRQLQATQYQAPVMPATGDPESLIRTKDDIAQEAASANRDVTRIAGSDVHQGIAARLGIMSNALKARRQAETDNTRILKEDQKRQSQELSQQEYTNAMLRNQASNTNFEVEQQNFQQTQGAARQGVNSSLNYLAAKEANMQNNEISERQAAEQLNAIKASLYQDSYTKALARTGNPELAKKEALESMSGFSGSLIPTTMGRRE